MSGRDGRTPVLDAAQVRAACASIAAWQLPTGMIPWFPGGHADPWNHVEAAMALTLGGFVAEAEAAYAWLAAMQHDDGSWCTYYLANGIEEPRRDTNVSAYVATGVLQHTLVTGDDGLAVEHWPLVEAAIEFVLRQQRPGGEITWSVDPDGTPGRFALLTGSSSVYLSLRCAVTLAEHLGYERPDWELAAGRLASAVAHRPDAFEPKDRWAMDWYYPVLSGALRGDDARARLADGWATFVMDGLGCRCVSDRPWVTAAETAELAMACDAAGLRGPGRALLDWAQHLRHQDGSYFTGMVHPQRVHFPGGERSTYTAAAMVLANEALCGSGPAAGLFRGVGLPTGLDLDAEADVTEA